MSKATPNGMASSVASTEAITAIERMRDLEALFLGGPLISSNEAKCFSTETLLDILMVLYNECCNSSLRKEKTVSEFIELGKTKNISNIRNNMFCLCFNMLNSKHIYYSISSFDIFTIYLDKNKFPTTVYLIAVKFFIPKFLTNCHLTCESEINLYSKKSLKICMLRKFTQYHHSWQFILM